MVNKITTFFEVAKLENKKPVKTAQQFSSEGLSDSYKAPKPEDFHKYLFRLLSADVIVGEGGWNCSLFPASVLREAIRMFEGVPAVYNHSRDVEDTVGNVVDSYYENAYIDSTGKAIPAGINGYFSISEKLCPDLCYKLDCEPSPIKSTSAMIEFEWEPSHTNENDPYFFWRCIGETINGEVVHMRATKIVNVVHQGLVYDGADPYAKKLKEGMGAQFAQFAKETGIVPSAEVKAIAEYIDKNTSKVEFSKTTTEPTEQATELMPTEGIVEVELSAEDKAKIENYNALVIERDFAKKEAEELKASIAQLNETLSAQKADLAKGQGQIAVLQKENLELATTLKGQKPMVELAKEIAEKKIAHTQELYSKSVQGKTNQAMLDLIEKTPFEALDDLIVSFGGKAMALFGEPTCDKCGNNGFSFRKSVHDDSYNGAVNTEGKGDGFSIIENRL